MNNLFRNGFIWLIICTIFVIILQLIPMNSSKQALQHVDYSFFLKEVQDGHIQDVTLHDEYMIAKANNGQNFYVNMAPDDKIVDRLQEKNVSFRTLPRESGVSLIGLFIQWLPLLIIGFIAYQMFRNVQSNGNRALGFGRSRARLMTEKQIKVTFEDVAGIDEAKQELEEVVDFLRDPQKFQRLGGRIPKGVLLVGPPGTGKTLLAKAIAGEAKVPFFSISGSDFVEMFVGVGASRVRDMFEQAKKNSPCIIFIDEIDAVGRHRGVGLGGGSDEREQTLNQLLVEMDGFEENQGIIIVAATNRPDILDPALLRPGRFDRQVNVTNPDLVGREKILQVHVKKVPLAPNVDVKVIARGTPGFSGADLANLVNEASLMAARRGKLAVGMNEFEQAKDKILMGVERKSLVMTDDEKKKTAYHEGGHAIIAFFSPESDPIHKATIIPRGRALGMVMRLPEGDRISMSRKKIITDIKVSMGGRIAEEMIFGYEKVTTGASQDIKMATAYATRMVTEWGLSDKLGFRAYQQENEGYLGHAGGQQPSYSEEIAKIVDDEINSILNTCYKEAYDLLKEKENNLHLLAKSLLDRETLTGEEIKILMEGGDLPPLEEVNTYDTPRTTTVPNV